MKYIIITKRGILAFCIVTILSVSFLITANEKSTQASAAAGTDRLPVYCVDTQEKKLAVTFDNAWGADDIDEILGILNKYNAKASFFMVGTWVQNNPECVKKIYKHGHEIGNHSDKHTLYTKLNAQEMLADLESCNSKIKELTGETPSLFRFPSGDYNEIAVKTVRENGMQPIQWNVDSLDWQGLSTQEIVKRVVSGADNGAIILFHNDVKNTPDALDEALSVLSDKGYSFVCVSELLYEQPYRIDATGKQYKQE